MEEILNYCLLVFVPANYNEKKWTYVSKMHDHIIN